MSRETSFISRFDAVFVPLNQNPNDPIAQEQLETLIDANEPNVWINEETIKLSDGIRTFPLISLLLTICSKDLSNVTIFQLTKKALEKAPAEALSLQYAGTSAFQKGSSFLGELIMLLRLSPSNPNLQELAEIACNRALPVAYTQVMAPESLAPGNCVLRDLTHTLATEPNNAKLQALVQIAMRKTEPRDWLITLEKPDTASIGHPFLLLSTCFTNAPYNTTIQTMIKTMFQSSEILLVDWFYPTGFFTSPTSLISYDPNTPVSRLFTGLVLLNTNKTPDTKTLNFIDELVRTFLKKFQSEGGRDTVPFQIIGGGYLFEMVKAFSTNSQSRSLQELIMHFLRTISWGIWTRTTREVNSNVDTSPLSLLLEALLSVNINHNKMVDEAIALVNQKMSLEPGDTYGKSEVEFYNVLLFSQFPGSTSLHKIILDMLDKCSLSVWTKKLELVGEGKTTSMTESLLETLGQCSSANNKMRTIQKLIFAKFEAQFWVRPMRSGEKNVELQTYLFRAIHTYILGVDAQIDHRMIDPKTPLNLILHAIFLKSEKLTPAFVDWFKSIIETHLSIACLNTQNAVFVAKIVSATLSKPDDISQSLMKIFIALLNKYLKTIDNGSWESEVSSQFIKTLLPHVSHPPINNLFTLVIQKASEEALKQIRPLFVEKNLPVFVAAIDALLPKPKQPKNQPEKPVAAKPPQNNSQGKKPNAKSAAAKAPANNAQSNKQISNPAPVAESKPSDAGVFQQGTVGSHSNAGTPKTGPSNHVDPNDDGMGSRSESGFAPPVGLKPPALFGKFNWADDEPTRPAYQHQPYPTRCNPNPHTVFFPAKRDNFKKRQQASPDSDSTMKHS